MKKKQLRLESLIRLLSENKDISRADIYSQLKLSEATLKRYLSVLRGNGFVIESGKGFLTLLKKGSLPTDMDISFMDFQILLLIYNNQPCLKSTILQDFCDGTLHSTTGKHVDKRTMHNYLKKLCGYNLITKTKVGNDMAYTITDKLIPREGYDFQKTLCLINYLKVYGNTLPFREDISQIVDKLEVACINHLKQSIEVKESIAFAQEVFPDCVMETENLVDDEMIDALESICLQGKAVGVEMKSGGYHEIRPFLVVFNWYIGCWYLVFRYLSDEQGYDMFRLDRIDKYQVLDHAVLSKTELKKEIDCARVEIEESFLFSLEKESKAEVLFLDPDPDELEEIERQMRRTRSLQKEKLKGNNYLYIVNIRGTADFLAWIRRFGRKAIFFDETLSELHRDSAMYASEKLASAFGG